MLLERSDCSRVDTGIGGEISVPIASGQTLVRLFTLRAMTNIAVANRNLATIAGERDINRPIAGLRSSRRINLSVGFLPGQEDWSATGFKDKLYSRTHRSPGAAYD